MKHRKSKLNRLERNGFLFLFLFLFFLNNTMIIHALKRIQKIFSDNPGPVTAYMDGNSGRARHHSSGCSVLTRCISSRVFPLFKSPDTKFYRLDTGPVYGRTSRDTSQIINTLFPDFLNYIIISSQITNSAPLLPLNNIIIQYCKLKPTGLPYATSRDTIQCVSLDSTSLIIYPEIKATEVPFQS